MTTEENIYIDLMLHANALRRFIANCKYANKTDKILSDDEIIKNVTKLNNAFTWILTEEGHNYWYVMDRTAHLLSEAVKSKSKYNDIIKDIEFLISRYEIYARGNEHLSRLLKQIKRYMKYRLKNILDEKNLTLNL